MLYIRFNLFENIINIKRDRNQSLVKKSTIKSFIVFFILDLLVLI